MGATSANSNGSAPQSAKGYSTTDPRAADDRNLILVHSQHPKQKPYAVAIPGPNPTLDRIPFMPPKDGPIADAGVARANFAPSTEHPNGSEQPIEGALSWKEQHKTKTVLQQHASYWDRDNDGVIWPIDTFRGIRAWGWNLPLALFATAVISGLSYPTCPGILPDPFFRIHLANLHKDHHGSSSGSYDESGRFKPQAFEDLWAKYDKDGKGGLTLWEIWDFHKGQRMVFDFFGWFATAMEWLASYLLVWPEDGVLRKEDMRKVIDGSIFEAKAREYAAKKHKAA